MSYILDALQKSEADRHQEKLPTHLAGTKPLLFKGHGKQNVWPVVIVALLIVNLGVLAYFVFHAESAGIGGSDIKTVSGRAVSSATASRPESLATRSEVAIKPDSVNVDPLQVARAAIAEQKRRLDLAAKKPVNADEKGVLSINEVVPESNISSFAAEPDKPYVIAPDNVAATEQNSEHIGGGTASRQPVDPSAAADGIQAVQNEVPLISDMDAGFQRSIPALTFSSHIYSSAPQGRRIMINNHYLREGQSFSGLKVEEITESGVILNKNGQSFKVSVVRNWSPN